jgi:three-Cys-motif partner protein
MGIYEGGNKGSPIAAFDIINKLPTKKAAINLVYNDKKSARTDQVKSYIDKNDKAMCDTRSYNLDIEEMFMVVISEVSSSGTDARSLIFIDPYGYKHIKGDILWELMKNGKTEIILFLPISHMQRFTVAAASESKESARYKPLLTFIDGLFDKKHPIRDVSMSPMEYIQCITHALKHNNDYYATSYSIERNKQTIFSLFFITSHIFGFEKMLETKWSLDKDRGQGFALPKDKGLFDEQYAQEARADSMNRLEIILSEALKTPKTNGEIYELTLRNEFLPKHANEILRRWQNEKTLSVHDAQARQEARKGSFYLTYENRRVRRVVFARKEKQ